MLTGFLGRQCRMILDLEERALFLKKFYPKIPLKDARALLSTLRRNRSWHEYKFS